MLAWNFILFLKIKILNGEVDLKTLLKSIEVNLQIITAI